MAKSVPQTLVKFSNSASNLCNGYGCFVSTHHKGYGISSQHLSPAITDIFAESEHQKVFLQAEHRSTYSGHQHAHQINFYRGKSRCSPRLPRHPPPMWLGGTTRALPVDTCCASGARSPTGPLCSSLMRFLWVLARGSLNSSPHSSVLRSWRPQKVYGQKVFVFSWLFTAGDFNIEMFS